jgi:hypothetical protein
MNCDGLHKKSPPPKGRTFLVGLVLQDPADRSTALGIIGVKQSKSVIALHPCDVHLAPRSNANIRLVISGVLVLVDCIRRGNRDSHCLAFRLCRMLRAV